MGIYAKTFAIPKLIEYPIGKQEGENVSSPIHYPPQGWSVYLSLYMIINVIVAKLDASWPVWTNPVIRELTVLTIVGSLQSSLLCPPFL